MALTQPGLFVRTGVLPRGAYYSIHRITNDWPAINHFALHLQVFLSSCFGGQKPAGMLCCPKARNRCCGWI